MKNIALFFIFLISFLPIAILAYLIWLWDIAKSRAEDLTEFVDKS